jgi:hypothetical protein
MERPLAVVAAGVEIIILVLETAGLVAGLQHKVFAQVKMVLALPDKVTPAVLARITANQVVAVAAEAEQAVVVRQAVLTPEDREGQVAMME